MAVILFEKILPTKLFSVLMFYISAWQRGRVFI